jgi:tRNA A-37 threonylcarbamoyl transferase component Bud32
VRHDSSTPGTPMLMQTSVHLPAVDALGLIDGYRLIEKLGEGGMGTVYLAEDINLKRRVALKVMKPHVAAEQISRDRFLREARAAAALDHDNIVAIHGIGEDNGIPYLAMPLLKGQPLGTLLDRGPRPDLATILKIARDVALGLAAAHEQGLIHRDIKPDNIWIEPIGGDDSAVHVRAKILDFGLARPRQEGQELLTQTGAILGTPSYMAPEQARGLPIDQRADLFSLGCVLYEMCAGRRPFTGADTMAVLTSLIADRPYEPRVVNPDIPQPLSNLIMLLLEKDVGRRPGSAKEVAEALRQIMPGIASGAGTSSAAVSHLLQAAPRQAEPYRPKGNGEWKALISALVGLLVLAGLVVGGFALFHYLPAKVGPGTLKIDVSNDAERAYSQCQLQIFEGDIKDNKVKKTLGPTTRNFKLPPGDYSAMLEGTSTKQDDTKDLALQGTELGGEKGGHKISFKIDSNGEAIIKVIFRSTGAKSDSTSDAKEHKSEKDK